MIKFASLLGLIVLVAAPALADPATAIRLRDQALTDSTAYDVLESLTTEIGPRPAGSPAQMRARDWALAKMKALGFTNIHAEPFAKQAWLRDARRAPRFLHPFRRSWRSWAWAIPCPRRPKASPPNWWC
jgi:hypothetical protein